MSLVMICPTKGRPSSVRRMGNAWEATGGHAYADLIWIVDADDPELAGYKTAIDEFGWMMAASIPKWQPMVPKLNWAARQLAEKYTHVGFLGDDHVPRSTGWSLVLAAALDDLGTGIVYGRDGYKDEKLPTWWAMSSDIIKTLGRMVPANVEHLYCDNAVYQLGQKAGVLQYQDNVLIEHMHPVAGKTNWDEGYFEVNGNAQYLRDRMAFEAWRLDGLDRDARLITDLRGV